MGLGPADSQGGWGGEAAAAPADGPAQAQKGQGAPPSYPHPTGTGSVSELALRGKLRSW